MILRHMRKGIFSAMFLGLLVMGGVGLVLTDWNGMFRGGITNTDLAVIDGEPLKIAEFDQSVRRVLRAQNMNPAQAYEQGLLSSFLQSEILNRLFIRESSRLGLAVDDKFVAKKIQNLITPFTGEGESPKEALARFLQMQGMSEAGLVAKLRSEISTSLLKTTLVQSSYIPSQLAQDIQKFKNEERTVETVFLANASLPAPKTPDDESLKTYYETISSQYIIPETRSATIALLDPKGLLGGVEVSDAEIKAAYEEAIESYKLSEQRILDQAVLSSESQAKTVVEKAKTGSDLESAVKSATGNTKAYSGKSSFQKDGLMKEISEPVFAAKSGDVVGPIQTPLGWHVLLVKEITPESTQPLEKVSDQIRKDLMQNKSSEQVYALTSQIEDRLAGGEGLESLAKEYKLTLISVPSFRKDSKNIPSLKPLASSEEAIINSAFITPQGETSGLNDLQDGRLYTLRTDNVTPEKIKDFKDVRSEILERWTREERAKANLAQVQTFVEDLNAGKIKLEKISAGTPKGPVTSKISRSKEPPKTLSEDAYRRFLSTNAEEYAFAVSADGITIGRVTSIKLGEASSEDKALSATKDGLLADLKQDNLVTYMESLQNKYKVKINESLLKRAYGQAGTEAE